MNTIILTVDNFANICTQAYKSGYDEAITSLKWVLDRADKSNNIELLEQKFKLLANTINKASNEKK